MDAGAGAEAEDPRFSEGRVHADAWRVGAVEWDLSLELPVPAEHPHSVRATAHSARSYRGLLWARCELGAGDTMLRK